MTTLAYRQAFPRGGYTNSQGDSVSGVIGMTYREWMIGQVAMGALGGYQRLCAVAGGKYATSNPEFIDYAAADVVALADAIIEAMEKR